MTKTYIIKYFSIVVLCMTLAFTVQAQQILEPNEELRKKEYANAYFDRCMEVPDPTQTYDSQGDMCICQAVHMQDHLNVNEMEILATGKGKGLIRKEVLFIDVYAPCLEFPVRKIVLNECYNDNMVRAVVSTQNAYEGACQCMSQAAVNYFRAYAKPQLAALMKQNPILDDPIRAIRTSLPYTQDAFKAKTYCLNTYQQEWEDKYYGKSKSQNPLTRVLKERNN